MAGRRTAQLRHSVGVEDKVGTTKKWDVRESADRLEVAFKRAGFQPDNIVNLSRWKSIGAAAAVFAEAFCRANKNSRETSRCAAANNIVSGLVQFLTVKRVKINGPDDIPMDLGESFLGYLKGRDASLAVTLSVETQRHYYGNFKKVVLALHEMDPRWQVIRIPTKPFAGMPRKSKPKELNRAAWANVMKAAVEECISTMDEVWPLLDRVHCAIAQKNKGDAVSLSDPAHAIAQILANFDGHFPRQAEVRKLPGVGKICEIEYFRLRRLAHPIGGDLIPFFLVLALHSGFNEQPLRTLTLDGISEHYPLGRKRIVIKSSKHRAGSSDPGAPQRAAFPASDHPLAPERLISFVIAWTRRIRDYADGELANDFFLHAVSEGGRNKRRGMHIDSYSARTDDVNTRVTGYITLFCKRRGLKYSGSRANRLAFSEAVDGLTDGDAFELRAMLGHRLLSTGQDSYQTTTMQRRQNEQLAGAMSAQERWVTSNGKIDTRSTRSGRERTAATPGFSCADPYQSPQPGQRPGKLCTSYGACPACPLAAADSNQAYALVRFLQLQELYEEARAELGIEIWRRKFEDAYLTLRDSWIPRVSTAANRASATMIMLTRLPGLE
ncbi:MAG: hypothetical protein ABS932_01610 [Stenotrophomonas sp.]|uniref:hypothetical protein n=1 Tax=Stenotrophomonas sp. TaxID=69392 RepID=UPI003314AA90